VRTFHEIECQDVVSSGISADQFRDKLPHERTKQAAKSLEEATQSYRVEVIPESHFGSSN